MGWDMSYFETILLFCLKQINGERTIYSIYHLFKGKKSSQTIQDAHLFEIIKYFGAFSGITREEIEKAIQNAYSQNWITSCGEQQYLLTDTGRNKLQRTSDEYPGLPYLSGWLYHQKDVHFWERLSLLVQVISNLMRHERHYIPIQKNIHTHNWLKDFLKNNETPRNLLGSILYAELVECLEKENQLNPLVLTVRLTGYERIGLTANQAAEKLKMELARYHHEFLNLLHYLLMEVSSPSSQFPLLRSIVGAHEYGNTLTKSAQHTFQLLNQGFSIEEAAKSRHLKTSTIEDHIVEIALNTDDFSIDAYIDLQLKQKILVAARKADSKQLKQIRSRVAEANYFQIRLVLAKYGVKQCD